MTYSLSDLILVWVAGMLISGFVVFIACHRHYSNRLSKEDAFVMKHLLSYSSSSFRQMFRNEFPIANDPTLSVRFPSWAAVNVFTTKMVELLDKW
jgi:hypothetical protein